MVIGVNYVGVCILMVFVGLGFLLMMEVIGLVGIIEMLLVIVDI